jgi:hypothetical protein
MRFPRKGDEMPLYLVSYDVAEKHAGEYQALWDYLGSLGSLKVLYSEYAVPFQKTALELANAVNVHLKKGDHLMVSELFKNGNPVTIACSELLVDVKVFWEFLNKHARALN